MVVAIEDVIFDGLNNESGDLVTLVGTKVKAALISLGDRIVCSSSATTGRN